MDPVATYTRTLPVGLARIWENVLDWEHLPWLHQSSFGHVRLLERRRDGWRAETSLVGATARAPLVIDVAVDREAREYHSRTVAGPGTGSDVVTRLTPVAERSTRVDVALVAPDAPAAARDALGRGWRTLYERLWDEDEAMMVRRQVVLDRRLPASCREVLVDGRRVRFSTACPHWGGPLDAATIAEGCVVCPWHGYRFDLRTLESADGRGLALEAAPA